MLKARPLLVHSLEGLRSADHAFRTSAAKQVRACVLAEMRDGTVESFSAFLRELNKRIFELVSSSNADHTIGGVLAIDELIDGGYDLTILPSHSIVSSLFPPSLLCVGMCLEW